MQKQTRGEESRILLRENKKTNSQGLYLDRDGVMIEDVNYISDPKEVTICPGLNETLRMAKSLDIPVLIVTNQSGISREKLTWENYYAVTQRMIEMLDVPEVVYGIFANSTMAFNGNIKEWRKPGAGMILESSEALNIDIKKSILIGDRITDLQAGVNAGMRRVTHVLTGHGKKEREHIPDVIYSTDSNSKAYARVNKCASLVEFDLEKELSLAKEGCKFND